MDVLDHHCTSGRTVALPELGTIGSVSGFEKEGVADGSEVGMFRKAVRAGMNILDHHRTRGRTVALPELVSIGSVVGYEIEDATDGCEVERRTITSAVDVLNHGRFVRRYLRTSSWP